MNAPFRLVGLTTGLALASRLSAFSFCVPDSLPGYHHAVGIAVGTNGFGAEWATRAQPAARWQYRVAVHWLAYRQASTVRLNNDSPLLLSPTVQMSVVRAQVDFHPIPRRSFHFTGGLAYGLSPKYAAHLVAEKGINYTGINLAPDEFGSVDFSLRWWRVIPYLGLGVGRAVPLRHRLSVSADLGCFYLGSPKISFATDGLLDATTLPDEIPRIEQNMKNYRFLPSLNLFIRYRLTP